MWILLTNVYSIDTVDIVGMVNIVYNTFIAISYMYDVYCIKTDLIWIFTTL